ncbi:MAG TPA: hypothetical protein VNH18_13125 [Bryobacteraceae bacterium]|nr:hypothetical protein [Bryobacteraceae bacterium]
MKKLPPRLALLFIVLLCPSAQAVNVYVSGDLTGDRNQMTSHAHAEYLSGTVNFAIDFDWYVTVSDTISGPRSSSVSSSDWGKADVTNSVNNWSYQQDPLPAGCYIADASASAQQPNTGGYETQTARLGTTCFEDSPPPSYETCHLFAYTSSDGVTVLSPMSGDYLCNSLVSLTATPTPGWLFVGWSGDIISLDTPVTFRLWKTMWVTANFTRDSPPSSDPLPDIEDACNPQCSPIVINFADGGYRLTGANAPVLFDMSGSGHPRLIGWTAAGEDEAFLWLDRNHNHRVTGGAELFGNFTQLQNGHLAKNGFEALAEFDANYDGVIDNQDPVWSQLMLWRDLNHNGISEPNEIEPLDASDVTAIDLHDHWTGRYDSWGNAFRYESLISIKNPSGHATRKQPVYDIFFVSLSQ